MSKSIRVEVQVENVTVELDVYNIDPFATTERDEFDMHILKIKGASDKQFYFADFFDKVRRDVRIVLVRAGRLFTTNWEQI